MPQNTDVLNSEAVALLCDLEHAALDLHVVRGRLRVEPADRLTNDHERRIRQHRDALITLVRVCDPGVQERLAAFKQQAREVPTGSVPDFIFRRKITDTETACVSCGERLSTLDDTHCWRCSLAAQMAAGTPIAAGEPEPHRGARVDARHGRGHKATDRPAAYSRGVCARAG